ncbi:UDP-glucosyltransferase 2-like [Adelges cooleyi]|uniref:UDP-glucosyltransferase 2-like n=1 Tax=Adelges cooleyi TaxID=133065 RepID=UPI0021808C52|nr:UDP-glucosyltransferase 2-like [Adelges cooleyi]
MIQEIQCMNYVLLRFVLPKVKDGGLKGVSDFMYYMIEMSYKGKFVVTTWLWELHIKLLGLQQNMLEPQTFLETHLTKINEILQKSITLCRDNNYLKEKFDYSNQDVLMKIVDCLNFMNGFLHSLTDVGHNVTVFTWFPEGRRENYTEIVFKGPKLSNIDLVEYKELLNTPRNLINSVVNVNRQSCDIIYSNSKIKTIMTEGNTGEFDVIVSESYASDSIKSNPRPYDYVEPVKPSLVFVNSHFIVEPARPMPPNFIEIGGIHLAGPKAIPKDIQEFIDNSSNGVIYFTFGSTVKMSSFPDHIRNAFKLALARLPQRILWKYESEIEDKPDNVMTKKWFPQRDILLHPNIKLFIGHGGISGVFEAVDAGVPVLGFPLVYDQPRNIANLVDAGMAISLDVTTVTETQIFESVNKLINNETYSSNAKLASKRFKDRPMSPAKTAAYWTEFIVRHKGAQHLKTKAFDLTWYEYYLLDILSLILVTISLIGFIIYTCLKVICKPLLFKFKFKTE